MKRRFLVFGIYQYDDGETVSFDSIIECNHFPTKEEVKVHMQSLIFSKLKGITGITELSKDDKWEE